MEWRRVYQSYLCCYSNLTTKTCHLFFMLYLTILIFDTDKRTFLFTFTVWCSCRIYIPPSMKKLHPSLSIIFDGILVIDAVLQYPLLVINFILYICHNFLLQ